MSWDKPAHRSDKELASHNYTLPYETIETVPLRRPSLSDVEDSEEDILPALPPARAEHTSQKENLIRQTQPTQMINQPRPRDSDVFSLDQKPIVQVAASSPLKTSPLNRKPGGILASTMAPAGTAFRRPYPNPRSRPEQITIDSDDEGPRYLGDSSDSEGPRSKKNDIKTSTFVRKQPPSEAVLESPQARSSAYQRFMDITSKSMFQGPSGSTSPAGSNAAKRSADVNANAYGNVSKKPRQRGPSRALPTAATKQVPELELDDISDYNVRQKVKRMMSMVSMVSISECCDLLRAKKGNYDDAINELLQMSERRHEASRQNAIDLTGSDDELMPTPANKRPLPQPKQAVPLARQHAKAPQKTIAEKWSSTQHNPKPRVIDVFDTPPPQQKKRTLVRGRKQAPSSPVDDSGIGSANLARPEFVHTLDSGKSDLSGSEVESEAEHTATFQDRLLEFFNSSSSANLADIASIDLVIADHIISERPFQTLDDIRDVRAPDQAASKGRRRVTAIGERIVDKVEGMLESLEAVDYLVEHCQELAKPLAKEMKGWGVSLYGSQEGEIDLVSLDEARLSNHDSGIGTPLTDDDVDTKRTSGSRKFIAQPSIMSEDIQMKDYQVVGVNWLNLLYQRKLSCILADDMGLGKTCQVIAFLAHLLQQGKRGPHLVVVPSATLENWLQEFHRFCPTLVVEPYYAAQPRERGMQRDILDDSHDEVNVIVTTYSIAKGKDDFPWLKNFGFDCTIYDEGHVLKNADSQVASRLMKIKSNFRLLLTGTPLQNNLKELISLLSFLMPSIFKEKSEELRNIFTHNVKAMDENHEALLSAQRIKRARTMLTPFILRRKKFQVLKDLPVKERRVELCDMTPVQSDIYQAWLDTAYSIREQRLRGENVTNESSNILMKLRQAAIHPLLFRRCYPDKVLPRIAKQCLQVDRFQDSNPSLIVTELHEYSDFEIHQLCDQYSELQRFVLNDNEWLSSGKVQKMVELLRKFMSEGHKTLIFSQFVMVLDILELALEREMIPFFRLDGATKVSERQDLIDEFNSDDNDVPVFMLSTKAGGAGINLASANKVIVFDSGFNPQDDIQAENRAHRIGQTKEVEVIRLVSRGTVEEQIHAMGLTKLKLDEQVAGDRSEEQLSRKEGEKEIEKEAEGRMIVEDLFFKKLDEVPIEQVKAEVASPVKTRPTSSRPVHETGPKNSELAQLSSVETDGQHSPCAKDNVELPTRAKRNGKGKTAARG